MDKVKLPSTLLHLKFGNVFNQSMENVSLLSSLLTLTFGRDFNQIMDKVKLPSNLLTLRFGHDFVYTLPAGLLPTGLEELNLGYKYRCPNQAWPSQLDVGFPHGDEYCQWQQRQRTVCGCSAYSLWNSQLQLG